MSSERTVASLVTALAVLLPGSALQAQSDGPCVKAPPNMVAWWPGDDCTPYDLLETHDGTFVGAPFCPFDWKVGGGALGFQSSPPTYITVPHHADLEPVARQFGIDYHVFAITKANKAEQEERELALLDSAGVDLIVMARYMQILSEGFIARHPARIINIHHSFLPAFMGGRPYHQAVERGVKLIGATAHYATTDLDEGPIIEQDVIRASHRDSVADLVRKGRDVERTVLSRAVRWHLDDRVIVTGNKTVVFD